MTLWTLWLERYNLIFGYGGAWNEDQCCEGCGKGLMSAPTRFLAHWGGGCKANNLFYSWSNSRILSLYVVINWSCLGVVLPSFGLCGSTKCTSKRCPCLCSESYRPCWFFSQCTRHFHCLLELNYEKNKFLTSLNSVVLPSLVGGQKFVMKWTLLNSRKGGLCVRTFVGFMLCVVWTKYFSLSQCGPKLAWKTQN